MKTGDSIAHIIVSGMVQGVFFRASARDEAKELGIRGWVRNMRNGKVEAMAQGPKDKVEAFIDWCHQGPPYARVSDVAVEWEAGAEEFKDFSIRF